MSARKFRIILSLATGIHLGFSLSASAAVPYPPPTKWKGINYSPKRHSYFRMLYDWYSYDTTAGQYVYQMVDNDLTRLSQNGYNVLHLYLWDRNLLKSVNVNEPAGFCSDPADSVVCPSNPLDPSLSPNQQWQALNDFVTRAESKGLFVALQFANGRVTSQVAGSGGANGNVANSIASEYANWARRFIQYLTPAHSNVIMWGLNWAWQPDGFYPNTNRTWQLAYQNINATARARYPSRPLLGVIGVYLELPLVTGPGGSFAFDIIPRNNAYTWDVQHAQNRALTMRSLLSKDPDIYLLLLYTPNSADLAVALSSLKSVVPASKIFVHEFSTSSSLTDAPNGNNVATASISDAQVPTTTVAGHAQWLSNALCGYTSSGITKFAYWAMYDPYMLWSTWPWNMTGQDLAWLGFWGLDYEGGDDKPAWSNLASYYLFNSLSCLSSYPPIVSLQADTNFYTVAQPIQVTWTAADVQSLSLSQGHGATYSCLPRGGVYALISPNQLVGSCAFTSASPFYGAGSQRITLTSFNGNQAQSASVDVTIGNAPVITAVTNSDYTSNITQYSVIIVWGQGFSVTGGNTIQLTRAGFPDVWLYETDGAYYWDDSHTQINAALNAWAAPGQWTAVVRNGYTGTPSAGFVLTIN
jgi:hypothetical protein